MAIVLALVIVGWLVAFALGNQAGFSTQPDVVKPVATPKTSETASASYRETASVS